MNRLNSHERATLERYAAHAERTADAVKVFNKQVRDLRLVQLVQAAAMLLVIAMTSLGFVGYLNGRSAVRQQQLCQILGSLQQAPTVVQLRAELRCKDVPHPMLPPGAVPPAPVIVPAPAPTPAPTTVAPSRTRVRSTSTSAPAMTPPPARPVPSTTPPRPPSPSPSPSRSRPPVVVLPTVCVLGHCV